MQVTQGMLDKMRELRLREFDRRVCGHLLEVFPEHAAEFKSPRFDGRVAEAMRRAEPQGIVAERGIVKFIETLYRLRFAPPQPELSSWAQRVLASPDLDPVAKIDHVHLTVLEATTSKRPSSSLDHRP